MLYNLSETLILQYWRDKDRRLIRYVGKETLVTEKSPLDYATLWRSFRKCFSFEFVFLCIQNYDYREKH